MKKIIKLKSFSPDRLALAGSVLGTVSLFLNWFTLKLNRLSSGEGLQLYDYMKHSAFFILLFLWLLCLFLGFMNKSGKSYLFCSVTINLILILEFLIIYSVCRGFFLPGGELRQVSIGSGIWVSFFAAYIVIFSVFKKTESSRLFKNLTAWLAPIVFLVFLFSGGFNNLSIVIEFYGQKARFAQEFLNHIQLVAASIAIGSIIGIALGILSARSRKVKAPVFFVADISQTIPSLALFGLLIAPLSALSFKYPFLREMGIKGIGKTPALIALVIYSLLPIIRNTYISFKNIDPSIIDAAKGMGMGRFQIFKKIEMPLALTIILEGVRIASVQLVGLTAVAALIGAGGFGWFIFQGLGQAAPDMILLGTIPIILLALFTDIFMKFIINIIKRKKYSFK